MDLLEVLIRKMRKMGFFIHPPNLITLYACLVLEVLLRKTRKMRYTACIDDDIREMCMSWLCFSSLYGPDLSVSAAMAFIFAISEHYSTSNVNFIFMFKHQMEESYTRGSPTMSTICEWITLFFLVSWCAAMIYNGIRQGGFQVVRWGAQPAQPFEENAGSGSGIGGHAHAQVCDRRRVKRPSAVGFYFEPFQYSFSLKNLKKLKGIHTITFTMNYVPVGHAVIRRSALSKMTDTDLRNLSLCKSVLSSYDHTVDRLRDTLSKKGKVYHDPDHPVILRFEYRSQSYKVYSTSFLIYHANLYCYCFKACGKWLYFTDSPYKLIDENGDPATNLHLDSSHVKGCYDAVGASTLIEALKNLNTKFGKETEKIWKAACMHLVFCFIEAARFRDIEHFVRGALQKSIQEDPYFSKQATKPLCFDLVKSWGNLCDSILDYEEFGVLTLTDEEKQKFLISGLDERARANCAKFMVPVRLR